MPTWDDYHRVINGFNVVVEGDPAPERPAKPGWELFADPVGRFALSVGSASQETAARYGDVDLADVELTVKVGPRTMTVRFARQSEPNGAT